MSDPFRKWAQGDEWEPSASQLNTWTDAARMVQQSLNRPKESDGQLWQPFTPIRLLNNTGVALPPLGVVTYGAPMVLPSADANRFINEPTMIAAKPGVPLDRFAITLGRVEIGAIFWGICGGVVPCKVTGTGTKVQAIANDVEKLQAGTTGLDLIWFESGSSVRYGVVKLFGAGSGCVKKFQLFVFWNPSGGSFTLPLLAQAKDPETGVRSGSYLSENITIQYNSTVSETKTALESHSRIDAGEIIVSGALNLLSGPHTITLPEGVSFGSGDGSINSSGLERGGLVTPYAYLSECCS